MLVSPVIDDDLDVNIRVFRQNPRIVGIDHLHGPLGWRRFIAEQRNRLPEIPDKCLGIKTNIEVDVVRQQARRDAAAGIAALADLPRCKFTPVSQRGTVISLPYTKVLPTTKQLKQATKSG